MGIESDQLVYDYLSRVGDAAQQRQLPSGERMRLVSTLRNEIDRQRGRWGADNPAAVRRILGRLGTPDAVVEAASSDGERRRGAAGPEEPRHAVPEQRKTEPVFLGEEPAGERTGDGEPGREPGPVFPEQRTGPRPPSFGEPEWWRIGLGPMDAGAGGPGILAGIEIPEMLRPPPEDPDKEDDEDGEDGGAAGDPAAEGTARSRWRARLRRGRTKKTGKAPGDGKASGDGAPRDEKASQAQKAAVPKRRGLSNPFLLLAAALLVVGAVAGSWLALAGGWLLAYASRTLSRAEAKWAVFGLPGISAAGGLIWLWGRVDGRWGEPIPKTGMADALSGAWPVILRTAAVASALYLIWRSRRR
ncbi:hypothetical protein [Streptomyces lushanensis]|uniref:hypothetical protein n=1 Tax=Streptomyces lushanensis TaxID=1434255 RepID=UPI000834208B|nr:hypothetical protein [Streptomyces lushanensis]